MKIGTRARYSLRLMMAIAKLAADGHPLGLQKAARYTGISHRYAEQLVAPLRKADLIRAVAGRGGGYLLERPSDEIRVGEIIEAAIGVVTVAECASASDTCIQEEYCNCRALWMLVDRQISETLHRYTLADLVDEGWSARVRAELDLAP